MEEVILSPLPEAELSVAATSEAKSSRVVGSNASNTALLDTKIPFD